MPNEALYSAIAERFGFSLPQEYILMDQRNFFTLKKPVDVSAFAVPGDGYLWLNDMEWYRLSEIAEFSFPDFYEPHLPHLVPFAFTGGGDYWCWQTDRTNERGTRVLLCPHDCNEGNIYAPNFAAALFRQALSYACYGISSRDDIEQCRGFLVRWAVDLSAIWPREYCDLLRDLADRSPVNRMEHGYVWPSFLDPRELRPIEQTMLGFPELDESIQWSDLDE